MAVLPMFPLGAVLFPNMPLQLRVFEERYLIMLAELLKSDQAVFGVVLIERGSEVGGGEQRFETGTMAQITHLSAQDGFVLLSAQGGRRFQVRRWLEDAPHPRAEVAELDDLTWDPAREALLAATERQVRRTLALASEFSRSIWPPDVELSADPKIRLWQLAAIAPLTALDQIALLRAASAEQLLRRLSELTEDAATSFEAPWPDRD